MYVVELFFKSLRLARELDQNYRLDKDPERAGMLMNELSASEGRPRKNAARDSELVTTGSVPHPV